LAESHGLHCRDSPLRTDAGLDLGIEPELAELPSEVIERNPRLPIDAFEKLFVGHTVNISAAREIAAAS